MTSLLLMCQYIDTKVGATGLTVTVDVDTFNPSTKARVALVTGGSAIEARNGRYYYWIDDYDESLLYAADFMTADTDVDQQYLAAYMWDGAAFHKTELAHLDADVSSRSDGTGVTLADGAITAAKIATDAITSDELAATATAKIAAAIWAYVTRTLTQAAVNNNSTSAGLISRKRGDTWSVSITGLGAIAATAKVYVTLKEFPGDPSKVGQEDDESVLQVLLDQAGGSDGLLYVNKAAPASPVVATDASVTVDDADVGNITLAVAGRASALIMPSNGYYYDVSIVTDDDPAVVSTPGEGVFVVTPDVTKAVS